MDKTLYDKKGKPVAYIAMDYREAVFLWDGQPVAYLYEERHLYGLNGRHLGWFVDEIVYDPEGSRIGFTTASCPVPCRDTGPKGKRSVLPEIRPRWAAPPLPKLTFREAAQELTDFLDQGRLFPSGILKGNADRSGGGLIGERREKTPDAGGES